MSSIKISELNALDTLTYDDFFPLVDSASLTTYRANINSINNWMRVSGSVLSSSWASSSLTSTTASYSLTSSFLNYNGSYNGTASYAISSSHSVNSDTASYIDISSVTNSTYSVSSSWASSSISASYSITSSHSLNTITASYAITSSYSFNSVSASYAISSSNAFTASYALTATIPAIVLPSFVSGLVIYPNWTPYDASNLPIDISADSAVLTDGSGNTQILTSISQTNNRSSTGAGGLDTGTFTNGEWYDIWLIYNSGTTATSTVISNSGATPNNSSPTMPSGYDFKLKIGSIKDESGTIWREWYEYGMNKRWIYRNDYPTNYGIAYGYDITQYLSSLPRKTTIKLKLKSINTALSTYGFSIGDELRSEDFIADTDENDLESQIFGTINRKSGSTYTLQLWRARAAFGTIHSVPINGYGYVWDTTGLDVVVISEL